MASRHRGGDSLHAGDASRVHGLGRWLKLRRRGPASRAGRRQLRRGTVGPPRHGRAHAWRRPAAARRCRRTTGFPARRCVRCLRARRSSAISKSRYHRSLSKPGLAAETFAFAIFRGKFDPFRQLHGTGRPATRPMSLGRGITWLATSSPHLRGSSSACFGGWPARCPRRRGRRSSTYAPIETRRQFRRSWRLAVGVGGFDRGDQPRRFQRVQFRLMCC